MSLVSVAYLGFLGITCVVYWRLPQQFLRCIWLFVASVIFYVSVAGMHWLILAASVLVTWCCLFVMEGKAPRVRRRIVRIGVLFHIFLLLSLKYGHVLLPLGASFYLLQAISIIVDAYRGEVRTRSVLDVAMFLMFFPKLLAGPLEKSRCFLAQTAVRRQWQWSFAGEGCQLLLFGFFKKLAVADAIHPYTQLLFTHEHPSVILLIAASVCFAIEILADFSGYTDIARGSAAVFGIDLLKNFDAPYLALTPSDFWRRWHISLSQWFRDYVFIPLGGSRTLSPWRFFCILLLTMGMSGIWHGVGWTFALWGVYFGILLFAYHQCGFGGHRVPFSFGGRAVAWVLMMIFILLGWLIFRAPDIAWLSKAIVHPIFRFSMPEIGTAIIWTSLALLYALPWILSWIVFSISQKWWIRGLSNAVLILALLLNSRDAAIDFYYFHF